MVAATCCLAGCFPQFGAYDGESGGGGAASVSGAGGQGEGGAFIPVPCGLERICVDVPPGWEGPLALKPPGEACDTIYPQEQALGKEAISAPPAACTCTCGPATGGSCGPASYRAWLGASCASDPLGTAMVPNGCLSNFGGGAPMSIDQPAPPPLTPGTCRPAGTTTLEPPSFETRSVCGGAAIQGACEVGVCAAVPTGEDPRVCVRAPGDTSCPGGAFTDKFVIYDDVADDRSCSCTCGPEAGSCSATVSVHTTTNCSIQAASTSGACTSVFLGSGQYIRSVSALITHVPGMCPPVFGPMGGVTGAGPTTICCTPRL